MRDFCAGAAQEAAEDSEMVGNVPYSEFRMGKI